MPNETPTWDDTIEPPSWEDTSPIDSQFRRDELAKETFQARLEGEQAKALTGLTDIGTEAAKAVVRAASHVDPTGFTQGLMQQYGVEPTHVIPPEVVLEDVKTVSQFARQGLGNLGIDPNIILPEQYRKPAEEFVAETIASTPEMAPLLAAGTVAPRAVGRVFQAQMLQGVPQTAYQAFTAPTTEERVKAGLQTAAGLAFPALIERGMRQPSVPIPDFVGRQLEMQRGAIPPRGEPIAPIERVTPEQSAVAAERMSAPFEGEVPKFEETIPIEQSPQNEIKQSNINRILEESRGPETTQPIVYQIGENPQGHKGTISFETYDEPSGQWQQQNRPIVISKSTIPGDKPWRATVFAGPADSPVAIGHIQLDKPYDVVSKESIAELGDQLGRYTRKIEISTEPVEPSVKKADVTPTVTESTQPPVAPTEAKAKEPWEMTKGELQAQEDALYEQKPKPLPKSKRGDVAAISEYDQNYREWRVKFGDAIKANAGHEHAVIRAIKSGKPVPPEVLADYPDLKPTPKVAETPVEAAGKVEAVPSGISPSDKGISQSERVFRSTAPGQKAMASRASRIATLHQLNEAIRKADPKEAYDRALIDSLPDSQIDGMRDLLVQDYNKFAAKQPAQPIPQGPGARTAQTIEAPESYSGTALKNATAEIERAGWGMAEAPEHVRQSIPEAWIRAGRSLERDPMAGQKLVDDLQADPKGRGLSVDESALLLRQKVILTNEMNAAAEGIHTAKTPLEKARAEANYDWAHEKMLTMLDAIKNRGTAWGQEGRWRQVMAREDFSLATLITQREAALGRKIKPGTPEFEELKKHADRLQELNSKLEQRVADVEKEFQDSEVRRALAEAQANANKELPYHPRILELAEGYAKKWDARGAKALADLKAMFDEGQAFSGTPISPAMLDKAIIYGTSKMVRGAVDLAKWTDTMVKDLGEGFRKYAKDVFDASKRAFDQDVKTDFKNPEVERKVKGALKGADLGTETILKQIAGKSAKAKEGRLPNINYYLRKLGRVYAREGIKEEGPFLDRMTADVQKVLPNLTRDDVRAIFGGYAEEVRALSKEPVEVILRDMRGQSRELHKLSLLKQKIIPPKLQERATPSEAERQIRKQVEAEKRTGGFAPPDPEVQLRSAMQSAETRLTNQITDLQREIDSGEKIVKQQRAPLKSEKLDALRERRKKLREIHDEVFKPPDLTDSERLEIWKKNIKESIDELRDRRERGDFKPKPKPDPIRYDKQAIELQFKKEVEHRALMEMRFNDEMAKRTTPEVIRDSIKNSAMFAHMAMAGGEFSAVFKQGATGAYSTPIRTARNFAKSLEAWWSEENQFKIKHEILTRDNAPFYRRDKLEFTDVGGRLSSMEEMYMFRTMGWMKKVPLLRDYVKYMDRFQRAFSTFLNLMRADTYDAMVREMGSSPEAGQSAANYINVATGRGSHSTARFGGAGANAIFFAPRWSISRFQYLLGQPILAAKPGFKKYIVKQYGKTLLGLGSVYALGYAMGGDVDWNPTSSKFGKIQIGNRVIDPLFGLAPVMRIIAQQITGLRKNYKGKVRPIREGGKLPIFEQQIEGSRKLGPYDPSGAELMGKFAWSKLAPAPEATVSAASGENVIGEKFNVGQKLGQLVTPITYRDVFNAIKEEGVDENTIIDLLAIFGLSSYIEKPRKSSTNF